MATQVGFQLESSLASKHLTDAEFIKGGYIVVSTTQERDALPKASSGDGVIVTGSLVYVAGTTNKSYRYNGTDWTEETTANNGTLSIQGNGTTATTFTANQNTNVSLNIKGSGGTTVTKSANNEITISSQSAAAIPIVDLRSL